MVWNHRIPAVYFSMCVKFELVYLEHVLPEHFLILLSVLPVNSLAERREVDETIPGDLIGQVKNLLLQGIQAKHFQGSGQVLCVVGLNRQHYC